MASNIQRFILILLSFLPNCAAFIPQFRWNNHNGCTTNIATFTRSGSNHMNQCTQHESWKIGNLNVSIYRHQSSKLCQSSSVSQNISTLDWNDIIDACYLITCPNADKDGARLKKSIEVLHEVNLLNSDIPTVIKKFDTDDEDRIRGCYTSHIAVLNEAYKSLKKKKTGTYNILVMEDNVALTENVDLTQVISQIASFNDDSLFDVLHLAYICYVPNLKVSKTDISNVVKLSSGVGSSLGTTAYIISLKGIEAVLKEDNDRGYYYRGRAIPDVMAELFPQSRYASYPVPFHRASKVKSLVNPQLDSLREVLFEPAIVLKVQSVLAETGLSTNALLPITISLLLGLSGASLRVSLDAAVQIFQTGSYDGFVLFPIVSSLVSLFSLVIIGQGAALAPKPQKSQ